MIRLYRFPLSTNLERVALALAHKGLPVESVVIDPARRAEMLVFTDWFNRVWKRPPNEIYAEMEKPAPDAARIERLGKAMAAALDLFEEMLAGRDGWPTGSAAWTPVPAPSGSKRGPRGRALGPGCVSGAGVAHT